MAGAKRDPNLTSSQYEAYKELLKNTIETGKGIGSAVAGAAKKMTVAPGMAELGLLPAQAAAPTPGLPSTVPVSAPVPATPVIPVVPTSVSANTSFGKDVQGLAKSIATSAEKINTPWYQQGGWGISGKEGNTPLGEQPTAVRTNVEHGRTTLQAYGIPELTKSPEQIATERSIARGGGGEPSATPTIPIVPEATGGLTPQGSTPAGKTPWYYGGQSDPNDAALRKLDDMIERASNPRTRAGGSYLVGLLGARNTMAAGISAGADRERSFANLSAHDQAQLGVSERTAKTASEDRRLNMALGLMGRQDATEARREATGETARYHGILAKEGEERNKIARDTFKFNVEKFNEGNNLKDPMNFAKAMEMFSPDAVDEFGTKTGKKNYSAGAEALSAMGYPTPKGMKIPGNTKEPPPGAQTGTYKGKRAYQLNGKYYDQSNGAEIK